MRNDNLRELAQKLIQRWYDLRVWAPEVIARQRNFCLYVDREGHLLFTRDCGPRGIGADPPSDPVWFPFGPQFDEAIALSGCTAGHFRRSMERLWRTHPAAISCYLLFSAKLRRGRRWLLECLTPESSDA